MKPDLEKIKEITNQISLSSEEKFDMFENLRIYSNAHPVRSFNYSIFMRSSIAYATMLLILVGTSATSFASEDALPGDLLYPIKTEVNERVVKSLAFTKEKKAKVAIELVNKRMNELEEMMVKDTSTPEKVDTIAMKLEEHKGDIQDYVEEIKNTDESKTVEATNISTQLESVVDTHIDILTDISSNKDDNNNSITATGVTVVINSQDSTSSISLDLNPNKKEPVQKEDVEEINKKYAMEKIIDFSNNIEPIINTAKENGMEENSSTTEAIKTKVRRDIIDTIEKKLEIDIKDEQEGSNKPEETSSTDTQSQTEDTTQN